MLFSTFQLCCADSFVSGGKIASVVGIECERAWGGLAEAERVEFWLKAGLSKNHRGWKVLVNITSEKKIRRGLLGRFRSGAPSSAEQTEIANSTTSNMRNLCCKCTEVFLPNQQMPASPVCEVWARASWIKFGRMTKAYAFKNCIAKLFCVVFILPLQDTAQRRGRRVRFIQSLAFFGYWWPECLLRSCVSTFSALVPLFFYACLNIVLRYCQ